MPTDREAFTQRLVQTERAYARLRHDMVTAPRQYGLRVLSLFAMGTANAMIAWTSYVQWQEAGSDFWLFVCCINVVSGCMCAFTGSMIVASWTLLLLGVLHMRKAIDAMRAAVSEEDEK